ncbi:MAG: peptide-methionine (S)-S-oxide reductase [Flavobacteriaceae bacterium]
MRTSAKNNKDNIATIALGGSCHWCTEALFQSLIGVCLVEQGYVASGAVYDTFSEAVVVHFNKELITLKNLIEIHLHTHKCTSRHSMRAKYRSAIYTYDDTQAEEAKSILIALQKDFEDHIITEVLPFKAFKLSEERFHNYYYSNPEKPFCENYINPKLQLLQQRFSAVVDQKKL